MTQMPPHQPPSPQPGFQEKKGASGVAIAAMILGICGVIPLVGIPLALVGIILGIVALAMGLPGKGMATTGIVVGIVGGLGVNLMLVGILLPSLGRARELAKQAVCQANLNAIGKAIAVYETSQNDHFPLLWNTGDPNAVLNANAADDVWAIQSTNSMNNLSLLVRDGMLSIGTFHCLSDSGWLKRTETGRYGWTDLRQFSYGLHWPYGMEGSKSNPAALWRPAVGEEVTGPAAAGSGHSSLDGSFVIMAERNPGGSVGPARNPANHFIDGQAILHRDYSVSFYKSVSDSNAGVGGDDIYTNGDGVAGGMPTSQTDTSITPAPSR